jgi:pimeloyl-ACP methyl ester carboxylesterase
MERSHSSAHSGPAVLLLHGQPGSPADWQLVADSITPGVQILIPDRPGYGSNPQPAGDFAANGQAMIELLDSKGIDQVVVAGYSWAGGVAIDMAARYPERVAGLALVASIGPGAVGMIDRLVAAPGISQLAAHMVVRLGVAAFHPRLRRPLAHLLERRLRNAARSIIYRDHHRRLAQTFVVEQRAMVDGAAALAEQLPSISTPTVVMHAQWDYFVSVKVGRALSEAIPGAELREIPHGSHYLPHHYADLVADAINSLLS